MNLRLRTACAAAALAFTSAAPVAAQPTVVATVGFSSHCQFDDLQEAIDFVTAIPAPRRVLEVERGTFDDNFSLDIATDQIEIVGGFESCGDPEPGVLRTRFLARRLDRVLTIEPGPSPRSLVRLANLSIERGREDFGGGVRITGPVDVVLENTQVFDNAAKRGGGVFLGDSVPAPGGGAATPAAGIGPTLALLNGSGVNGNQTVSGQQLSSGGGGIACEGSGRIVGGGGSGVINNETDEGGTGGGILLTGCELDLTGPFTVSGNRANVGGGIAVVQGRARLRGTAGGAVRVIANTAEPDGVLVAGRGGGLSIAGDQAELIAENVQIDDNRARSDLGGGQGGGLLVTDGALARLDRTLGADCPDVAACSSLSGNQAGTAAAARVIAGRLEIRRTVVRDNAAALGSVLQAVHDPAVATTTELLVEGSTLTGNSGRSLFEIVRDARLETRFSTAAGNFGLDQVVRGRVVDADPGEVLLVASILYETSPGTELLNLDPGIGLQASCLVVPEGSGLPSQQVATTDDPQFVDLGQGDLHLAPTSPALDVCAGFPAAPATDLDLDLRGHDLPEVPDRFPGGDFVFDAGADEIGPPGPIFSDGFESGDLSAWSGTAPTP